MAESRRRTDQAAPDVLVLWYALLLWPTHPGAPITITGEEPDKDYFLIGLGLSARFSGGLSGFIDWQTLEGYDDLWVDSISFGLRWDRVF